MSGMKLKVRSEDLLACFTIPVLEREGALVAVPCTVVTLPKSNYYGKCEILRLIPLM